jgi:shikimate kinase
MQDTIVLLGPYLAGKSTLRSLLADALERPQCALVPYHDEELCERYYSDAGYDRAVADRIFATEGPDGVYEYMKPFEAAAVVQCVAEHPGHVIEIGAAHVVQDDPQFFQRIQQSLAPYPHVLVLLPSPDPGESYQVLRQRYWDKIEIERNEHYVKHHSNHVLAKHTVYTKGKTPLETRDEVLQLIQAEGAPHLPVVLIGPPCAGKSTIADLLSVALAVPQCSTDWGLLRQYYRELGYDEQLAHRLREEEGHQGIERYAEQFGAAAIRRLLAEHGQSIIDFGAGLSMYEDEAHLARVQEVMAPYANVILLLPSPDLDESVQILKERPRGTIHGQDSNLYLLNHHAYADLGKAVIYTQGKTPEETCDEILRRLAG